MILKYRGLSLESQNEKVTLGGFTYELYDNRSHLNSSEPITAALVSL